MAYLEGEEPSIEKLKSCIRKGTLAFAFTPIVTGTAFKNKGVQTLLDAIVDYMPSPLDRPAITGVDAVDIEKAIERPSDDNAPFAALAFKIMNDPFVGTLTFTRIYSGTPIYPLDSTHSLYEPLSNPFSTSCYVSTLPSYTRHYSQRHAFSRKASCWPVPVSRTASRASPNASAACCKCTLTSVPR